MKVHMVYFAAARELAACSEEVLDHPADELSLMHFVSWLGDQKPRLAPYLTRMRFARNDEFASADTLVRDGDELSVLPPVAGGSVLAEVRDVALSVDEVIAAVRDPGAGAIALFLGMVRDHHQGTLVARLDYEAHRSLAEREMARVIHEQLALHPGVRLAALHRVGELAIGDIAVVVAASSAHREQAFAACRAALDGIKANAPIWKKEWSPDGSALWINLERDERT
ncbi:MAG TPA: molybdenum cofactor biosynthesis protein MoaE [Polyangiales bacterium]|nr:molybdenum cofactor biosynthesis protein MoaE [Polyangiales bacterium]